MLVLTARDIIVNFAKCNYEKGKHSTPVIVYSLIKKKDFQSFKCTITISINFLINVSLTIE